MFSLSKVKGQLFGCSNGANPITDSMTLGSIAQSRRIEDENHKKACKTDGSVTSFKQDAGHVSLSGSNA